MIVKGMIKSINRQQTYKERAVEASVVLIGFIILNSG